MGVCKKHEEPVDIWYDCAACAEEADKWAQKKGYTHAVSPGIDQGDHGKWVHRNRRRWVFTLSEILFFIFSIALSLFSIAATQIGLR